MLSDPGMMTPAGQAARVLAAWAACSSSGLREELRRSLELDCPVGGRSLDEEQLELLRAAAGALGRAPDPLEPADARLQRCLYLLRHLASTAEN